MNIIEGHLSNLKGLAAGLSVALLAVVGCSSSSSTVSTDERLASAMNRSWISVSGTIASTSDDSFQLDYGTGQITVEMDDSDWYPEGRLLLEQDRVVVYGRVDDGFYEKRTIEAAGVYVKSLGTYFYASSLDEEDFVPTLVIDSSPRVEMTGTVESVVGRTFALKTAGGTIIVDTQGMSYNPLDDEGFQQLDEGDRVRVSGEIKDDLFDRDLDASIITVLQTAPLS